MLNTELEYFYFTDEEIKTLLLSYLLLVTQLEQAGGNEGVCVHFQLLEEWPLPTHSILVYSQ